MSQEELHEGLYMGPVQASNMCDSSDFITSQIAHFIKSLVVHYVSGTFNRQLREQLARIQACKVKAPMVLMQIPKVPAAMKLFAVKKSDS